jgi:hypothetical protein
MHTYALVISEYLVMCASAAFAYRQGGVPEKLGALLFGSNIVIGAAVGFSGTSSPIVQLIADGVFALGLLPLAMIFVSCWIGVVTFIAAALFALEALYLLNNWPIDKAYLWINNSLWLLVPLVFLISGFSNLVNKRRMVRVSGQPSSVASAIG